MKSLMHIDWIKWRHGLGVKETKEIDISSTNLLQLCLPVQYMMITIITDNNANKANLLTSSYLALVVGELYYHQE